MNALVKKWTFFQAAKIYAGINASLYASIIAGIKAGNTAGVIASVQGCQKSEKAACTRSARVGMALRKRLAETLLERFRGH